VRKEVHREREKGFCSEVTRKMIFGVKVTRVCFLGRMCICAYVYLYLCVFVGMCRYPIPSLIAESDIRACQEEEVCWMRGG